ncbi:MAG: phosphate signaling complex protein PhoU [Bacillota bacterium]
MPYRKQYMQMLEDINMHVLRMGSRVERTITLVMEALLNNDIELASSIITDDKQINNLEREIEDKCVRLLATQTPVARDLRFIFAINKITKDIERIGDLAVNIAHLIKNQKEPLSNSVPEAIPIMADQVTGMVRDCLDAFVRVDVSLARDVHKRDEQVDARFYQVLRDLLHILMEDGTKATVVMPLVFIDRYLERMADHITNVCEWIVYFDTGERLEETESSTDKTWLF